ncbi:HAD-IIB family hydrolase [Thiohalorhabdus methylotrophus]|uniref:HAD-IIB family hydrolase n=1 Tax=Thiohalorhabdus methylotrophus TaxID=3242694 RepID=A0ABV4TS04_9GAMM
MSRLLATDMDRTLVPNGLQRPEAGALDRFRDWASAREPDHLAYVTGRHRALALEVVAEYRLPEPDWLICNVGTEIYAAGAQQPLEEWEELLEKGFDAGAVRRWAEGVLPGARLQEPEKQSPLKVSFYLDEEPEPGALQARLAAGLDAQELDARVVVSYDETEKRGLVDFLAPGSGKARALDYLRRHLNVPMDRTLFAGDSGNDADALLSGVCGVLVGNATDTVRDHLQEALASHQGARVLFARRPYTAGILEGMAHYGWEEH